ncbi:hypothetical protein [Synechococcus sp. CBW1107]|uniref:hypothetical protein n=1 Tax=Synechococcus sp. CBW1107 TaxID=2789857 RepID=UPI002AD39016|nr:hypothetical protein [Synechococcus sp. CBW1107]CAK6695290.1 hypothetical protein ICNINCKA_01794 [Synechococcus sp. CBW1107]
MTSTTQPPRIGIFTHSSRQDPCPICGRDTDGDCRIREDRAMVLCHRGSSFHPPNLKNGETTTGHDGQIWAYTRDTGDGRAACFVVHEEREGTPRQHRRTVRKPAAAKAPKPAPLPVTEPELAILDEPITLSHPYAYSPRQRVIRVDMGNGKKRFEAWHKHPETDAWTKGAGPNPWPVLNEDAILAVCSTGWPVEIEGEKCAGIITATGVAAFCQPGHAHNLDQVRDRYRRLVRAGARGILLVSDSNDADTTPQGKPKVPEGLRRARISIEAAAWEGLPLIHLPAADVWPELDGVVGASIDDVQQPAADALLQLQEAMQRAWRQASAEPEPATEPERTPSGPTDHSGQFILLGMEGEAGDRGSAYAYLIPRTGQVLRLSTSAHTSLNLCDLAPLRYWEANFPGERSGVNWAAAASDLFERSKLAGVFDPDRIRGRGVWRDDGHTVHHLGDALTVDGEPCKLTDHGGRLLFPVRPPLALEPADSPLSDDEGRNLLSIFRRLEWRGASDHLYLAGLAVIGPISGALSLRPQAQLTGDTSSGKSVILREVLRPLWGGEGASLYFAKATAAGIRQALGEDALPVLVDESEQEDPKLREQILNLARHSYDATPIPRGTTHGRAIVSRTRALMVLAGINATIPEAADRNRFVVLSRGCPDRESWAAVYGELTSACTPRVGARLIRRTTANLNTLLSDASHLRPAIAAMLPGRTASRWADTLAPVLAGARLLTTTTPLQGRDEALAWLDSVGWSPDIDSEDLDPIAEPRRCLDHLLSFAIHWRSDNNPSGQVTFRELIDAIHRGGDQAINHKEADKTLGRYGVKVTDTALVVAVSGGGVEKVYGGTRWAKGAHTDRLRSLPGAVPHEARIPSQTGKRCTWIPFETESVPLL